MRYQRGRSPAVFEIQGNHEILGKKVRLRGKKLSDARNDYMWQSNPELAGLDAAPVLTVSFAAYLLDYSSQLHDPGEKRFPLAVDTLEGEHIGNCTCYDIDAERGDAQLGIMIGDSRYRDRGYGTDAVTAMVNHVFSVTKLKRIYLKTLDWNLRAQKCFENCGFEPCRLLNRNGSTFVVMELLREKWERQQSRCETDKDG